jgi:uncharacterized Tic20 family protein
MDSRGFMTSNPSQPAPEQPAPGWSASEPTSEPLDALPPADDSFYAGDRRHTGAQEAWPTGPQEAWQAGPQQRWQGSARRWPAARAPWPDPSEGQAASIPEPRRIAHQRPAEPPEPPPEPGDERLATISYLGVPFLGPLVPMTIYLTRKHRSGYIRYHSAQALNLSITTLLYTLCILILGSMLALDTVVLALSVAVPLLVALWLATLGYVILVGSGANRGDYHQIPAWLCATIVH